MRTASLEPVEDLAEILEPTEISTLDTAPPPPSKVAGLVVLGGLLVAFTVGAGFVLLIVQSKTPTEPPRIVTKTVARAPVTARPIVQPMATAPDPPPIVGSAPILAEKSPKTAAQRKRLTVSAADSPAAAPAVDSPAAPAATPAESSEDWVDPFDDHAAPSDNEATPSDEWKDPFADSRKTAE